MGRIMLGIETVAKTTTRRLRLIFISLLPDTRSSVERARLSRPAYIRPQGSTPLHYVK